MRKILKSLDSVNFKDRFCRSVLAGHFFFFDNATVQQSKIILFWETVCAFQTVNVWASFPTFGRATNTGIGGQLVFFKHRISAKELYPTSADGLVAIGYDEKMFLCCLEANYDA